MLSSANGCTDGLRPDRNESPLGLSPRAVARVVANAARLHRCYRGPLGSVTEAMDLASSQVDTAWFVTPGFDAHSDRARALSRAARPIPLDAEWKPAVPRPNSPVAAPYSSPGRTTRRGGSSAPAGSTTSSSVPSRCSSTRRTRASRPRPARPEPYATAGERRLLVFRSFSESHGLAGIRLGALIGTPRPIAHLRDRQRFHSVNSVALHAPAGALEDPGHRAAPRSHLLTERPRHVAALAAHPLPTEARDSHAGFVVAPCREDLSSAEAVERSAVQGVRGRDCGHPGLPGWLRITVGTAEDLRRLTGALTDIDPVPASADRP